MTKKRKSAPSRRAFVTSSAAAAGSAAVTQPLRAQSGKYLIVACDGGGIRGLITALLLNSLNTAFPSFLGQAYLNAGTSTGGILSLGLACGIPTSQLVNLYSTQGSQIFTASACAAKKASVDLRSKMPVPQAGLGESWWEFFFKYIEELICPWYDNTGLKTVVTNVLGTSANAALNSLVNPANPRYVLVNTLQLCNANNIWTPLQLTNLPGNTTGTSLVVDAAMSTSAAPMYFPPYQHPVYSYCADGGLFANNPGTTALAALIEAGVLQSNVWMLSLSTGNTSNCYPASTINGIGASSFGPIYWAWPVSQPDPAVAGQPYTPSLPLMGAVFDGTSQIDDYYCAQLLPGRYQRARVPLPQPIAMDDYSPAAIQTMTTATNTYMQSSTEWAGIQAWIRANFS